MKSLTIKLMCLLLPLLGVIVSVNYLVDPGNLFSGEKYVKGIASILLKNHNVDNIANYDQRLLQYELLAGMPETPEVMVLGSSRVMEISSEFYPGKRFFNCAVSHANVNDIISLVGLLDSLKKTPDHLVLGVDPFIFSDGGTREWQSLKQFHQYAMENILHENYEYELANTFALDKIYSLVSFDYFKESISFVLKDQTKQYSDVGSDAPVTYGKFADGSFCYSYSYTHPDTIKMASDAREDALKNGLPRFNGGEFHLLKAFLGELKHRGVDIDLVMVPYHDQYYTTMNQRKVTFQYFEKAFHRMATDLDVRISGSFDPKQFGLRYSDFYDRWHCSKAALKKVLSINAPEV